MLYHKLHLFLAFVLELYTNYPYINIDKGYRSR